jgi:hypothetical protein
VGVHFTRRKSSEGQQCSVTLSVFLKKEIMDFPFPFSRFLLVRSGVGGVEVEGLEGERLKIRENKE